MPELEYFLVVESVSIDQTTNRISFFHVLEEIQAPEFPIVIPRLTAVAAWNAKDGDLGNDFQATIVIPLPDGQHKELKQNFHMIRPRHRTIANIVGLPIAKPSTVTIEIRLNGEHAAFHAIEVRKSDA